jgi:NhaC family Na+:H+ antiporter
MLVSSILLSGTVATMLSYGAELASPTILYALALVLATVLGVILGSSFTTIAGLGVPFVALAPLMGLSPEITAAALVAGAFTGDGIAPVSDTLVLTTDMVGGVPRSEQSKRMMRLLAPGWLATLGLMIFLGIRDGEGAFDGGAVTQAIETEFSVSLLAFIPLIIVFVLASRTTAFAAVFSGALSAVVLAGFTQQDLIERLAGGEGSYLIQWAEVSIETLATGFNLDSATVELNSVFFGGGAVGMLPTIWLILVASAYGGLMSKTGMLKTAIAPLLRWATTSGRLIIASAVTVTGFNLAMADPYVSMIVGAETFRDRFKQARLEPVVQSVSIAGSGSLLSSIIPWNVHGAFVGGVLGIGVLTFAGFAVVIWATPLVLVAAAMLSYRNDTIPTDMDPDDVYGEIPDELPDRRTTI